jgi:2-polyprenyl-6-methoxyphenol hydroxylase-like FAD-dependent oxidoreductase
MAKRAVVIGGSIGGLLAGAALSATFDEVVLLEKSDISEQPEPRAAVPQGQHAHGLLAGGLEALDELLPELLADLAARGCPTGDNLSEAAWVFGGKRLAFGSSGVRGMTIARPVLEHVVRQRVHRIPNLRTRANIRVLGLSHADGRITGVHIRDARGSEEHLGADLVVDASGRNSKSAEWLAALGFPPPRIDEVALETRYTSRVYSRRATDLDGAIALMIVSDPACPRGGIALALDDERWLVSQYAMGGSERPPADHAGYVEFARSLPSLELATLLARARPLTESATLRFPSSVRRRYEDLRGPAAGFIVFADALCSFNPTFGQGITVAAKQALLLRALAPSVDEEGFERRFFDAAASIVDVAWNVAAGRSFLYSGVTGRPTLKMRLANAYLPRVIRRAHDDVAVATALLRTLHFLAPPESLFAPAIMRRVFTPSTRSAAQPPHELWQTWDRGFAADSVRYYDPREDRVPRAR